MVDLQLAEKFLGKFQSPYNHPCADGGCDRRGLSQNYRQITGETTVAVFFGNHAAGHRGLVAQDPGQPGESNRQARTNYRGEGRTVRVFCQQKREAQVTGSPAEN